MNVTLATFINQGLIVLQLVVSGYFLHKALRHVGGALKAQTELNTAQREVITALYKRVGRLEQLHSAAGRASDEAPKQ